MSQLAATPVPLFLSDGDVVEIKAYFPAEWGFAKSDGMGGPPAPPQSLYIIADDGGDHKLAARLDLYKIIDDYIEGVVPIDASWPNGIIEDADCAADAAQLRDVFLACAKKINDRIILSSAPASDLPDTEGGSCD